MQPETQDDLLIPQTPDSINPEWLTAALHLSHAVEHAKVISIRAEPVTAGIGFVGQTARLHIEYDVKEPGAPVTLFAKLSPRDASARERLRPLGFFKTEAGFYRDLAAPGKLPIRVPRPYVTLYEDTTGASILLIEDLGHVRFGDNVAGCSATETRTVVRQLALFHAHFWEAPCLKSLPWLSGLDADAAVKTALYRAMLPRFEQRCAEFLTPGLREAATRLADILPEYINQSSEGPHTLVHGDFRADNFAFTESSEDGGLIVFDWQGPRRGRGARDLAYFMSFSMPTEQRRATEEQLLELYYATLSAHGVKEYSFQDLARDFRSALGGLLITAVYVGGMLDTSSERGAQLVRLGCERVGAALEDHQFATYLGNLACPGNPSVAGAER